MYCITKVQHILVYSIMLYYVIVLCYNAVFSPIAYKMFAYFFPFFSSTPTPRIASLKNQFPFSEDLWSLL